VFAADMGIKEDLNLIHTQLGASKTKERKDGVSSLKTFVQSRAKEGTLGSIRTRFTTKTNQ
jgi:hypothetical protein